MDSDISPHSLDNTYQFIVLATDAGWLVFAKTVT
ncbi:hypothetical protein J2S49_001379 [Arcanobacterium wilhelmae]|uniref:Uncharacterized protein n=1 Tax=Arcanobacterium wilhelmae TaxID=1803177 RepID=A0ABT9NCQ9_9ACTO|nr:hypothetical protein [Arcanobacterium wilhelmae]